MPIPVTKQSVAPKRLLLRHVVRDQIRDAIMDGTLKPGETLQDEALQEWLGTSRTPIRDALNELARVGLIEMEPNRYTRVAMLPSDSEALEALAVLGVIYGGAAAIAIPVLTTAQARELDKLLSQAIAGVEDADADRIRENVLTAYGKLVEHSKNTLLIKLSRETIDGLAYKIRVARLVQILDSESTVRFLKELSAAIGERDGLRGRRATDELFQLPNSRPGEEALAR
ncbi:GntR family transcriptional regulator [Leifsonia xyli subsp. cynodontis DSM 46306]|uniref:HTH gntR-type domain-containing protein n=1 Tax=Leifsonia xyli subsp. cynodontis DSM 46306 TaxID=1389489 RepID=U3P8B0_LEIXC|nr:GntR family transcriptional regulator [Leifsonia xyli]AGW42046.1 GntR family transcriptional regulator [Leifsonia xyli subsp. cynodontis DSM 46306]